MKRKLLVITAAGASIDFGMPSVWSIDSMFKKIASEYFSLSHEDMNLYTWVRDRKPNLSESEKSNFERTLFEIQHIASILENQDSFFNPIDLPILKREGRTVESGDFISLYKYLVDELLKKFKTLCTMTLPQEKQEVLNVRKDAFGTYLKSLATVFEVGFINLNYDNTLLSTLPDLNTGFDSSNQFSRDVIYNSSWNFCYHLHGSVHFDMQGDALDLHKIVWNNDLSSNSHNSSGINTNLTKEGLLHINTSIITGLDKANQLLREPFSSYYSQLDRLIYESDTILFIGYGFSDLHLNRKFEFIATDKSKSRNMVVIDFVKDEDVTQNNFTVSFQERDDDWSRGLVKTLLSSFSFANTYGSKYPFATDYKLKDELEKVSDSLSICYNGLTGVTTSPFLQNQIIEALLGEN